jgi:predicted ester cyclase
MRQLSLIIVMEVAAVMSGWFESMRPATPAQTNPGDHKVLVRRWIDQGFNNKDLSVVDEIFSSDVIVNGQRVGHLGLKNSMSRFITAFPNLHVTIAEVISEGDKVVLWYRVQGTQTGGFEGIRATGEQVRWIGVDLFRIVKGKIVEKIADRLPARAFVTAMIGTKSAHTNSRPLQACDQLQVDAIYHLCGISIAPLEL